MTNRYGRALEAARSHPQFVDLIDTNFHRCGLFPPVEPLLRASARYFGGASERAPYAPDPAGAPALRSAICRWYGTDGWRIDPSHLIITASASESYSHIFSSILPRGSRVLLPRPGYPLFEEVALRRGLEAEFYDLDARHSWQIDLDSLAAAAGPETSCIVLISPNNPTGAVVPAATLEAVAGVAAETGAILLVDEVFSAFRFQNTPLPRPAVQFPDQPVCTINGVSKLFASPDLKVSWIAVSGPPDWREDTVEKLHIENDLYLNGSPLSQALATELFATASPPGVRMAEAADARRAVMERELEQANRHLAERGRSVQFNWSTPAGGIHLPVHVRGNIGIDDEGLAVAALRERHLNVHPGYLYGIEDGCVLVMSFLAPPDRIRDGVHRLTELADRLADQPV